MKKTRRISGCLVPIEISAKGLHSNKMHYSSKNMHYVALLCLLPIMCLLPTIFFSKFCKLAQGQTDGVQMESILQEIASITNCTDRQLLPEIKQRGEYWVFYNYVQAENRYKCYESITYTTQADYTFLDNIEMLVQRWEGPISVALYTPGYDFDKAIESILYLRNCQNPLIKKTVTFHLFFESEQMPREKKKLDTLFQNHSEYDCAIQPPYRTTHKETTFREKYNLTYPINVGRNIARERAETHFVFASDIELYPTKNLTSMFLEMIASKSKLCQIQPPNVFVLPIFEVLENQMVPETKTQLQYMYTKKTAALFHKKICSVCHSIPKLDSWMKTNKTDKLDVFTTTKRQGKQRVWEAFYIGTNADPFFDERLTWEGQSNKMTQAYIMCLMNYDYMVLNNAFLVHKPGIKKSKEQLKKHPSLVKSTSTLIKTVIKPELESIFGKKKDCYL